MREITENNVLEICIIHGFCSQIQGKVHRNYVTGDLYCPKSNTVVVPKFILTTYIFCKVIGVDICIFW